MLWNIIYKKEINLITVILILILSSDILFVPSMSKSLFTYNIVPQILNNKFRKYAFHNTCIESRTFFSNIFLHYFVTLLLSFFY